jgi:hypothetical protein
MKKLLFAILLVFAVLAGCSSGPNYKVDITKPLYFVKDKEVPFEIKVTENNKPVTGLTISADLSMANMDHGTAKATFTEEQKGLYAGKVKIPMNGKYEMDFTLNKGDKKSEKVFDYNVKKPIGVATINGKWIKNEDLKFYELLNKLQLAINRETIKKKYSGAKLQDELSFLDVQEKSISDKNQLLTQIIRTRSMALLGEEKGYKVSTAALNKVLTKAHGQYDHFDSTKKLIQEFGEEKFWSAEKQELHSIILIQQIQATLAYTEKQKNPTTSPSEINFQAQQDYEDLLESQVNSLKIEIL